VIRINLLPIREILRKKDLKLFIKDCILGAGMTLILMIGAYFYFDWDYQYLQGQVATEKKKRDELVEKNKQLIPLKNEELRLKRQVEESRKLVERKESIALLLEAVSITIPDEVWLDQLEKHQNQEFLFRGKGKDNKSVMKFLEDLKSIKVKDDETAFFSEVKLKELSAAQGVQESGDQAMVFHIAGILK
jgi:Tfp pilus assembly protein PilN